MIIALASQFHVYLPCLAFNQEALSRSLLRDCENRWIVYSSSLGTGAGRGHLWRAAAPGAPSSCAWPPGRRDPWSAPSGWRSGATTPRWSGPRLETGIDTVICDLHDMHNISSVNLREEKYVDIQVVRMSSLVCRFIFVIIKGLKIKHPNNSNSICINIEMSIHNRYLSVLCHWH